MENAQGLGRSLEAKSTLRDPHSRYLAPKSEESTEILNCKYYKYLWRAFGSTLTTVQVLYIVKLSRPSTEPG